MIRSLIVAAALSLAAAAPAAAAQAHPLAMNRAPQFGFQYMPMPDSNYVPIDLSPSTDGSLWIDAMARVVCGPFEICEQREYGHVVNGAIQLYSLPPPATYSSIAAGPQGTLWMVVGTSLYVFDATAKLTNVYTTPAAFQLSTPTLGADGRVWLTDLGSNIYAVTLGGTVSQYACPGCEFVYAGRDNEIWGQGLDSSYQEFLFSVKTNGVVTKYPGNGGALLIGPQQHLNTFSSYYDIETIDRHENYVPLASLQSLNLDQTIGFGASASDLWFVGTQNAESQGVVGTVSERGVVRSAPFANAPCSEPYVYFSSPVRGSDGAMYAGFGCGDKKGTHAGYLARIVVTH